MCGIIGMVSSTPFRVRELLERLRRMEYRGYDSFGYATPDTIHKQVGSIMLDGNEELLASDMRATATLGLAHTRWATHGGVTRSNAHPHEARNHKDGVPAVTIVHNGIIDNWQSLKQECVARGSVFASETDSEVIAHLVQDALARKKTMKQVLAEIIKVLHGTFAIVIMVEGDANLYALKRDSPLALASANGTTFVASDIFAFADVADNVFFFEDDEYAIIAPDHARFFKDGVPLEKRTVKVAWSAPHSDEREHAHIMHKEIFETPIAAARVISSLQSTQREKLERLRSMIRGARKVAFAAAGTAYHACLLGASMLQRQGVDAQAIIASEFESFVHIDSKVLVIAVSQSGETMDVITALKYARSCGASIASVVNVPYSTIERISDVSLAIEAGPEIAVASTKAFINQVIALLALAQAPDDELFFKELATVPAVLADALSCEQALYSKAQQLALAHDLYIIGRGFCYPLSREIALKIKEIGYLHAEGMMAGELKHGTIALIEQGTPVLAIVFDDDVKMRSSVQEVRSRGAVVTMIGTGVQDDVRVHADKDWLFVLGAAIIGQLLAYHIAYARGCPIDKPRNLAKSVTVM